MPAYWSYPPPVSREASVAQRMWNARNGMHCQVEQPLSLAELWQDALIGPRLRLPREAYQTCVRQATLASCVDRIVTISISDRRLKDTLERGYLAALRFVLGDVLGKEVTVRMVIYNRTVGPSRPVSGV